MLRRSGRCFKRLFAPLFLPFLRSASLFSPEHSEFLEGNRSDHFRADSPVQQDFFSPQLTCSQARWCVFLCPRGTTPLKVQAGTESGPSGPLDSVLPRGEMSTPARSEVIRGLGDRPRLVLSSRPSARSRRGSALAPLYGRSVNYEYSFQVSA